MGYTVKVVKIIPVVHPNAKESPMKLKMPEIQVKAKTVANPLMSYKQILEVDGYTYHVYYRKSNWSVYLILQDLNDGTNGSILLYSK